LQSRPFDEPLNLILFFAAEYRCTEDLPDEIRFKQAIEKASALQTALIYDRIRMEGEFSSRWRLNADGYSNSPTERFADSLAGLALAQILVKESDRVKRRALFLANIAWLCPKPSLRQLYPNETAIQKQFYSEPHTETAFREQEVLPEQIRNVLECSLDFTPKECHLY
jgi:hypothetical protein